MKRDNPANLTREALEGDWIGLHADIDDLKAERASLRREVERLKERIKHFEQMEGGRALGIALRALDQAKGRSAEHQANAARLQRQVNAQQAEIKRLRKADEDRIIPL